MGNKINYSDFTRFMRTLNPDVTVKRSKTTETVYYIFPKLKIRISNHFKINMDDGESDIEILVPFIASNDVYVVKIKDVLSFATFPLKELKSFIRSQYYLSELKKFSVGQLETSTESHKKANALTPAEVGSKLYRDIPNASLMIKSVRRWLILRIVEIGNYEKPVDVIKQKLKPLTLAQIRGLGTSKIVNLLGKELDNIKIVYEKD